MGSFYVGDNMEWPHLMEQALRAHVVYERDRDYVVERGQRGEMEVVIVDEFTGRKMAGRQWSDGLHQAAEAKENVPVKQETQTLATITLQNFFKLYRALSGMTGTALTEAEEFHKIYKLDVVSIPTNRPLVRQDNEDRVYRTEKEKWTAILEEIKAVSELGRPVLVGTTSVEKSEMLSNLLKRKFGVEHEVLNAKNHEREAQIVALAGQQHKNAHGEPGRQRDGRHEHGRPRHRHQAPAGHVLRGRLHARPEAGRRHVRRRAAGHRHPPGDPRRHGPALEGRHRGPPHQPAAAAARREGGRRPARDRHRAAHGPADRQPAPRPRGRQGDAGSSRFYVSLQDDLMKMFAGEWTIKVLGFLGLEEGMAIEDKRISRGILNAQKKVEERNYLGRKNMLEYDDVMDAQRTHFYGMRQQVLEGRDVAGVIWGMIDDAIARRRRPVHHQGLRRRHRGRVGRRPTFQVQIDGRDLRGKRDMNDLERYIKVQARAEAETNLSATIGEFTGEDETDTKAWDTRSLEQLGHEPVRREPEPGPDPPQHARGDRGAAAAAAIEQIDGREVERHHASTWSRCSPSGSWPAGRGTSSASS